MAELTNLEWTFDEASLAAETGIARIHILNDLQAQGYALGSLTDNAVRVVVKGRHDLVPGAGVETVVAGLDQGHVVGFGLRSVGHDQLVLARRCFGNGPGRLL